MRFLLITILITIISIATAGQLADSLASQSSSDSLVSQSSSDSLASHKKLKRSLQFDAVFFKPFFDMFGNNFERSLFASEVKRAETSRNPSDKRFKNLAMYRSLGSTNNYFQVRLRKYRVLSLA